MTTNINTTSTLTLQQLEHWDTLNDMEKTRILLQEVLGTTIYESEDMFNNAEWFAEERVGPDRTPIGNPVPYPAAYPHHDERWSEWFIIWHKYEEPVSFQPLTNLNDTWQLAEMFDDVTIKRRPMVDFLKTDSEQEVLTLRIRVGRVMPGGFSCNGVSVEDATQKTLAATLCDAIAQCLRCVLARRKQNK